MNLLSTAWDRRAFPTCPNVSFEFFPPASAEMQQKLWHALKRLAPLAPRFVSVTYGAGGSTRERTHDTVVNIRKRLGLRPAAHLTCVDASKSEISIIAEHYWEAGIRHIVALRGDPPEAASGFTPHPQGYVCAAELVAGLKRVANFEISVAAHPEVHPDAVSAQADLENLKRKQDAGAARGITQFFFDVEAYLRFRDAAVRQGISMPLVPGILPVTNFQQVQRFAVRCGASVPASLAHHFDGLDDDAETRKLVAAHVAGEQCRRLQAEGVQEFHFYTLNRPELTRAICHLLGLRASSPQTETGAAFPDIAAQP
ncbi:MAG TPA: methylenetetrahydrofolate reductase [NAD(P)H] [Gammaproteobacteria bacterium]|nr:methylenetetrahydrofolate reductase [NAD(P)H] [Gammaproteobacteria bacterium]